MRSNLPVLSALASFCLAVPNLRSRAPSTVETIYQFPNDTWVENLVVRSNGNILVTLISTPEVWNIDPSAGTADLIYHFPEALATLGLAEYAPDVFAVNVGNWSDITGDTTPGTWSVWSLDLNSGVAASKIADVPPAVFLNGMTSLPANPSTVLVADAGAGKVYSIETNTGAYNVAISGSFLQPNASGARQLGVNGIQFRPDESDTLYFDNSWKTPNFASVPVDPQTGTQAGPPDIIYKRASYPENLDFAGDDFTFDASGQYAWLTTDPSLSLVKVDVETGAQDVVVGGPESGRLVGPTACKFGRTAEDLATERLYITTNGGLAYPPAGIVGGKLVAIDTKGL